ncbi:MAG: 4Fe-4S binding protein [Candidatus Latescibacteria bacterium]|nr:4Fe-4S binding protein [Candidatus Latescibacterota bacterium]
MLSIEIHEAACRGCQICVDICPTDVFTFDAVAAKARIGEQSDCLACLSCSHACPAGAIRHFDIHLVKNFYRDLEFCTRLEKFL